MQLKNRTLVVFLLCIVISSNSYGQGFKKKSESTTESSSKHYVNDYPEGIYKTLDDFINKKHTNDISLKRMYVLNFKNKQILNDSIVDNIFFYRISDNSKYTNAFAVSFQGNLYFQQFFFRNYAKKGNANEAGNNPNSYYRVINDGNFFYLEGVFANGWAKGIANREGGIGSAIALTIDKLKGIVFDFDTNQFDFFKNCKDFNLFLEEKNVSKLIECDKRNIDIIVVREEINKIIK